MHDVGTLFSAPLSPEEKRGGGDLLTVFSAQETAYHV